MPNFLSSSYKPKPPIRSGDKFLEKVLGRPEQVRPYIYNEGIGALLGKPSVRTEEIAARDMELSRVFARLMPETVTPYQYTRLASKLVYACTLSTDEQQTQLGMTLPDGVSGYPVAEYDTFRLATHDLAKLAFGRRFASEVITIDARTPGARSLPDDIKSPFSLIPGRLSN